MDEIWDLIESVSVSKGWFTYLFLIQWRDHKDISIRRRQYWLNIDVSRLNRFSNKGSHLTLRLSLNIDLILI